MKTQRFGIEIEMTGITRNKAAEVVAEYLGTSCEYIGTYYKVWGAKDSKGRTWRFMYDGSIETMCKEYGQLRRTSSESYSCEMVSPILTYDDIPLLQEIIRKLRHNGAVSSSSYGCGIHIHVDAAPHTPLTLRNLVNLMASKEDLIYKSLEIAEERTHWCQKVNLNMLKVINEKKPQSIAELADLWYGSQPCTRDRSAHYNETRYHGLNLHSTFTKGTVEFRLFNGTTHAGEIRAYITFCLAISHQALVQKRANPRRTETDNEKYTFRCWLLRLGLIGDEFKNCREHLMKHLLGDAAWRDANHRRPAA